MSVTINTNSEEETLRVAAAFAKALKKGATVCLSGDLGAGKTAFTKGMARGLNIQDEVTSPTYAYVNEYGGALYHFDFYRLSSAEDAEALGLADLLNGEAIKVCEWAENVEGLIGADALTVTIEKTGECARRITLPFAVDFSEEEK